MDQERWLFAQRQDTLFDHGALDVVVLNDHILFEYLNGIQLLAAFALSQQNLRILTLTLISLNN